MRRSIRAQICYAIAAAFALFETADRIHQIPSQFSLFDRIRGTVSIWSVAVVFLVIVFVLRKEQPRPFARGLIVGAGIVVLPSALLVLLNRPLGDWPWIASALAAGLGALNVRKLEGPPHPAS